MKNEQELKQIAIDLHSGNIFSDRHLTNPEDISSVFMILSLLNKKQTKKLIDSEPGMIYEYIDKACPMSVNGYPTFLSYQILTKDEFKKMLEYYNKIKDCVNAL